MKRGLGSPNYNADRAREVRQMGNRALRAKGKAHQWTAGPDGSATVAGHKGAEVRTAHIDERRQPHEAAA